MEATAVKKTWKPTVAGILNIVTGSGHLLAALGILIAMAVIGFSRNAFFLEDMWQELQMDGIGFGLFMSILTIVFVIVGTIGVVSLLGGIYALRRRTWGLALAGSITSLIGSALFGILAIIFTAMSKDEFTRNGTT